MIIYEKNGGLLINFDNIIDSENSDISLMKVDNEVEVKIGTTDIADITPSSNSTEEEKEPEVKEPETTDPTEPTDPEDTDPEVSDPSEEEGTENEDTPEPDPTE